MLSRINKLLNEIIKGLRDKNEAMDDMKFIQRLLDNMIYYRNIEDGFKTLDSFKGAIRFSLFKKYIERDKDKYKITQKGIDKYKELEGLNDKEG